MFDQLNRLTQPWHTLVALTPLLGTMAFLAVSLPLTADAIQHLEHYRDQNLTAVEAFQPLTGAWYTVRSVVDNLALGVFGISGCYGGTGRRGAALRRSRRGRRLVGVRGRRIVGWPCSAPA